MRDTGVSTFLEEPMEQAKPLILICETDRLLGQT